MKSEKLPKESRSLWYFLRLKKKKDSRGKKSGWQDVDDPRKLYCSAVEELPSRKLSTRLAFLRTARIDFTKDAVMAHHRELGLMPIGPMDGKGQQGSTNTEKAGVHQASLVTRLLDKA